MRISDWSSDVCSSDLPLASFLPLLGVAVLLGLLLARWRWGWTVAAFLLALVPVAIGVAPEWLRDIPTAPADAPQVHLLTHNVWAGNADPAGTAQAIIDARRSEEHTSELQSLMRISYAVFCLK